MNKFRRSRLSITLAILFLLNQTTIANESISQNLDMKIISQVIEDYNEKLRPQKKQLVNQILEILDSFPEDFFIKIIKTYNGNGFKQFSFLVEAITILNSLMDKNSDEILKQKLEETRSKTFKCILDDLKDSITTDIKSRINIQVNTNFQNEIFSQEDDVYIIAAVGIPLLNMFAQIIKFTLYTGLSDTHIIRNAIDFDLKHNTLSFKMENINLCNIILNDDKSLNVKIFNDKSETLLQFVLKK